MSKLLVQDSRGRHGALTFVDERTDALIHVSCGDSGTSVVVVPSPPDEEENDWIIFGRLNQRKGNDAVGVGHRTVCVDAGA